MFECEYSDKTLVLDCDCYIFFTTFYSQMEVWLCQWLCWKVPWHSRFWHCDGVAYGCLFGKISVLQFVLLEAGDWLAYIVVGCQVCVWECALSRSRWQHGFSTLDLFGWTFMRFCDKSVVVELLGASSLWHRCDCVCLSLRLPVDLLIASLLLPPAFIPPWPFSGPPHIPEEDTLPMWSFVFVYLLMLCSQTHLGG